MQKIVCIMLMSVVLTSCADMNSSFDCPMKPGTRCESLDEVNARIDRGEIGHEEVPCHACQQTQRIDSLKTMGLETHKKNKKNEPLRYSESVMRVWIAPFEDHSGNYHKESEVFTVVKPGHWVGYPVHAILAEEE